MSKSDCTQVKSRNIFTVNIKRNDSRIPSACVRRDVICISAPEPMGELKRFPSWSLDLENWSLMFASISGQMAMAK